MSKFIMPIILFFIISCEPKEKDIDFEWVISDSSIDKNSAYSQHIYSLDKNAKLTIHHEKYNENHTDKEEWYLSGLDIEVYDKDWINKICATIGVFGADRYIKWDKRKQKSRSKDEKRLNATSECNGRDAESVRVHTFDWVFEESLYSLGLLFDDYNYINVSGLAQVEYEKRLKEIIFPIPDNSFEAAKNFLSFREESKSYAASIQQYSKIRKNNKNQNCSEKRAWRDYYLNKGDYGMYNTYLDELSRLGC